MDTQITDKRGAETADSPLHRVVSPVELKRRVESEIGAGGGGTRYAPIFERGGVRFIFLYADTSPSSEEEAWKIGWGMALVECILLGCKYHGEVLAWNPADDPQCQQGELGGKRIAVVGGWGEVLRAHGGSSHNDQAERHSEPNPR